MQDYITQQLAPVPDIIQPPVIYGSSCIIDFFQATNLPLKDYEHSKSHPFKVQVSEMQKFLDMIIPIPYDQREDMFKFKYQYYMWGIDKAFLNIINICKRVKAPFIIPSNANINQGLMMSLI